MEVNTNLSAIGVNGAAISHRSTPAQTMLSDGLSLTDSSALEKALQNSPASRPDMVDRGKALIADAAYPSAEILNAISLGLAAAMTFPSQ